MNYLFQYNELSCPVIAYGKASSDALGGFWWEIFECKAALFIYLFLYISLAELQGGYYPNFRWRHGTLMWGLSALPTRVCWQSFKGVKVPRLPNVCSKGLNSYTIVVIKLKCISTQLWFSSLQPLSKRVWEKCHQVLVCFPHWTSSFAHFFFFFFFSLVWRMSSLNWWMKLCATLADWGTTKREVDGGLTVHFINLLSLLRDPFESSKDQQRLFDKVTKYPSFCFHANLAFSTNTCTLPWN